MIGEYSEKIALGLLCWECGSYVDGKVEGTPRLCRNCKEKDRYYAVLDKQVQTK